MHIHIFSIDILPQAGIATSGGSLRSLQMVQGLREAGAEVTVSLPMMADGVRENWERLTAEEREGAFSPEPSSVTPGRSHLDILHRVKPDVAFYLWPAAFTFPRSTKNDALVVAADINGFQNVEGALVRSAVLGTRFSGAELTREYLRKISCADVLVAGSPEQGAYWSGLQSFVRDSPYGLDAVTLPYAPPAVPVPARYAAGGPTFYSAGSFLPWNSPEAHLEILARLIGEAGRGRIVVIGRANPLLPHARAVNDRLRALRALPFVQVIDALPYDEFSVLMNGRGVAVDLHSRTFEREYALPIRTVNYLAHGVPVITNDYAALSERIGRAEAGWQVSTTSPDGFVDRVKAILAEPDEAELARRSANARQLFTEQFAAGRDFKPLLQRLGESMDRKKAAARRPVPSFMARKDAVAPVVMIVTDDIENFLQLRIRIPFDALYRTGHIKGYVVVRKGVVIRSVGRQEDLGSIDVVWLQRGPTSSADVMLEMFDGRFVYDIDDNLLVSPSYRQPFSPEWRQMITTLLASARCVTTTTPRLVDSLQRHSEVQIEDKVVLAPNLTDSVRPRQFSGPPEGLVLASSDTLPLTTSRAAFLKAVNIFCRDHDMPLLYLGTQSNSFPEIDVPVHSTGFLDYEAYRSFLLNESVMAVAPLETKADVLTGEFINCKSDIKMVEFGACGVPAVYSKAVPYADSPLVGGPLVDCGDSKAILDALEQVLDGADAFARAAGESVQRLRLASTVAGGTWGLALEAGRLAVPVSLEGVLEALAARGTGRQSATVVVPEEYFDAQDYLAMHPHVAAEVARGATTAYEHYRVSGAAADHPWFPGTPGREHLAGLVSRYRSFVLKEPAKLTELEGRVAARG